jgi:hypothetical protein
MLDDTLNIGGAVRAIGDGEGMNAKVGPKNERPLTR